MIEVVSNLPLLKAYPDFYDRKALSTQHSLLTVIRRILRT